MKKLALLATAATVGLSGCVSLNEGVPSPALETRVRSAHIADIQPGQKVTGESSATILFGLFKINGDTQFADGVNYAGAGLFSSPLDSTAPVKSAAAYKAMKSSGADVLLAPTYITEVNNYVLWKDVKVTVNAYKGTIKGFKSVTSSAPVEF
ncbi:MAG: hypothetical protein LBL47_03015 [Lactobacillus sp.]|jgi:hypothetical protein|nr:hypothetical protein [Lactobacillus sp.]